jgi:hypothetical protein
MVGVSDKILDIQVIAQLLAHPLAVVQGHPARPVHVQAQNPSVSFTAELGVHQLQTEIVEDRLRQGPKARGDFLHVRRVAGVSWPCHAVSRRTSKNKEWALAHSLTLRNYHTIAGRRKEKTRYSSSSSTGFDSATIFSWMCAGTSS